MKDFDEKFKGAGEAQPTLSELLNPGGGDFGGQNFNSRRFHKYQENEQAAGKKSSLKSDGG